MEFLLGDCWNYWNGHYEEVKKQTNKQKKPGSAMTPCRSETQAYVGNRTVFINYMFANLHQSAWGWLQSIWVGLIVWRQVASPLSDLYSDLEIESGCSEVACSTPGWQVSSFTSHEKTAYSNVTGTLMIEVPLDLCCQVFVLDTNRLNFIITAAPF